MTIRPRKRGAAARSGAGDGGPRGLRHTRGSGAARCGFTFTTTGRPCANRVAEGVLTCRAGHPCAGPAPADVVLRPLPSPTPPARPRPVSPGRRPDARLRRVTDMVRQAMASDDVEHIGLRAEHVLADVGAALTLLGAPDASPAARATVIQRFGRVGALLVLGYEDRWHRQQADGPGAASATALAAPADDSRRLVASLLREFDRIDARRLYDLLCAIDCGHEAVTHDTPADAHRWLDATYAVAARDGTSGAHRAYMNALERVMRLVRPLVAS